MEKNLSVKQFEKIRNKCGDLFANKLHDYGAAWRILRPTSVTDQIYIKVNRIRTLETSDDRKIDEGIESELIGVINYGIIGLIQLELGHANDIDISNERAFDMYESYMSKTFELFKLKNHDYDEAWRLMRETSYTDLILMKINRTKQIETNKGVTKVSEGIDANYMDMINYAVFYMIKSTLDGRND